MVNVGKHWAWVEVDGVLLPEYQPEISPNGMEATVWIPSQTGKEFQICVRDADFSYSWATKLQIDGRPINGGRVVRKRHKTTAHHTGVRVSNAACKPFVFSLCNLVEDDNPAAIVNPSPHLGELRVDVDEVALRGRNQFHESLTDLPALTVSERAKKGIVHGTQLGEPAYRRYKAPWKTTTVRHVATFVFRYRPLDVLQANGLAPQPQDHNSGQPTEVIDLTVTIKDEPRSRKADAGAASQTIKKEGSITVSNEVIDLT